MNSSDFFASLSYFEFSALGGYISRFPSASTKCTTQIQSATNIPVSIDQWDKCFDTYFTTLLANNFGTSDIFWWLPNYAVVNASELLKYLANAVVEPGTCTPTHQNVIIKNNLDPEFKVPAYYKTTSLPGEAIDVVPMFVINGVVYTALGCKRESPRIGVTLSSGKTIDVLTVGIFGNVIFGEHLNPSEKACMNALKEDFFLRTQQRPVALKAHETSAAMRTLLEEAGIRDIKCRETYYVDFSQTLPTEPCRDSRYGILTDSDGNRVYGYGRESSAHTLCCIFECAPPENPIPTDLVECTRPTIVQLGIAVKNFVIGGKYPPAFPAHVAQFAKACRVL